MKLPVMMLIRKTVKAIHLLTILLYSMGLCAQSSSIELGVNIDGGTYTTTVADPNVDAGPNHIVQMINGANGAEYIVYDRQGTQLQSSTKLSTITGKSGAGDPIVLYDRLADRWLMSEIGLEGSSVYSLVVAISTTNSPFGGWHTYNFPTNGLADYPKWAVWPDAYYVTAENTQTPTIYAFHRSTMLAGGADPPMLTATIGQLPLAVDFNVPAPVTFSGTIAPTSEIKGMVMRVLDDGWGSSISDDALELRFLTPLWSVGILDVSAPELLLTGSFDSEICGTSLKGEACLSQPNSSIEFEPFNQFLMNNVTYHNFGTHHSIVCNHTVDADGNGHTGIRWYELRKDNFSWSDWSIHQEGVYAPDTHNRWLGAISINENGDIALAYNVVSPTIYPSLCMTGRDSCDLPGMMTEPETIIISGTDANGSPRYGDYNSMCVDPFDEETFWFTGMYNSSSNWSTRITSFKVGDRCCQDDTLILTSIDPGTLNNHPEFIAASYIEGSNTVASGAGVVYEAGDLVRLMDGMHIESGSIFCGTIDNCENVVASKWSQQQGSSSGTSYDSFSEPHNQSFDQFNVTVSPNPFRDNAMFEMTLPDRSRVSIIILNAQGTMIKTLLDRKTLSVGKHTIVFHRGTIPAGTYFYNIQIGNKVFSGQLVVID